MNIKKHNQLSSFLKKKRVLLTGLMSIMGSNKAPGGEHNQVSSILQLIPLYEFWKRGFISRGFIANGNLSMVFKQNKTNKLF